MNNKRLDAGELQHQLAHYTGSDTLYRHGLARQVLYTDGVKFLADSAGAYWLLDEIALTQKKPSVVGEEFQVWKLVVNSDSTGVLTCDDGNGNVVHRIDIPFTDFPLSEIKLYVANNTIMLPGEY